MSVLKLTPSQLSHILSQLNISHVPSDTEISISLSPQQLHSLRTSSLSLPPSIGSNLPTVESIILTTSSSSRIDSRFLFRLSNSLKIPKSELVQILRNSSRMKISELTHKLNETFRGIVNPPLTQDEVYELINLASL